MTYLNDPTFAARFWSHVDRTGDCWTWTGSRYASGYGQVATPDRPHPAHRIAWELTHGPLPKDNTLRKRGTLVLHTCDNPPCVRPDHLFLGTNADNMLDALVKGRNGNQRVDPAKVREIRARFAAGEKPKAIALDYGLSRVAIHMMVRRKSWWWVA